MRNCGGRFKTGAWTTWPEAIRRREPKTLAQVAAESGRMLAQEQVLQFAFAVQWTNLRAAAAQHKDSHSWRCGDFRQHGFGGCVDASGHLRA